MTVLAESVRASGPYQGNGATVVFAFDFVIPTQYDLYVERTNTTTGTIVPLTLGNDYSVTFSSGTGWATGTITLQDAPSASETITINSAVQYLQPTDFNYGGRLYPALVERALDRLTYLALQLRDSLSGALASAGTAVTHPIAFLQRVGFGASNTSGVPVEIVRDSASATDISTAGLLLRSGTGSPGGSLTLRASAGGSTEIRSHNGDINITAPGNDVLIQGEVPLTQTLLNAGVPQIRFVEPGAVPLTEGAVYWKDGSLNINSEVSGVVLQAGQELWLKVRNGSGSPISNGTPVVITGANSQHVVVGVASISTHSALDVVAVATQNIANNADGYATLFGLVRDINTSALTEGAAVYLGAAGALTNTPSSGKAVAIGVCVYKHASQGVIMVRINDATPYVPTTAIAAAGGVASLGPDGKIPAAQLPAIGASGSTGAFDTIQEFTSNAGVTVDGLKIKDGAPVLPCMRVYKNAQTPLTTTNTVQTSYTTGVDNTGMYTVANGRATIAVPGVYEVSWTVQCTDSPAAIVTGCYKNGSLALAGSLPGSTVQGAYQTSVGSGLVEMAAGDYLDIRAYYTSGTNVAVQPGAYTQFTVMLVSGIA